MKSTLIAALALAGAGGAASVAADEPPAGALPLSEVLRTLETEGVVAHFVDVEWDGGYWDVEYVDVEGNAIEIKLDPRTALPPG